jgi:hypothetical protein
MNKSRRPWMIGLVAGVALVAMALLGLAWANAPSHRTGSGTGSGPETHIVYANTACPIMGSAIDPAKVTEALTRTYKGQKIAFCCNGCPALWDKLDDAQKDAKLKAALKTKGS